MAFRPISSERVWNSTATDRVAAEPYWDGSAARRWQQGHDPFSGQLSYFRSVHTTDTRDRATRTKPAIHDCAHVESFNAHLMAALERLD